MCGIAGCLLRDREPKQESLVAMAAAIRHRGPDHQEVKIAGMADFAHARLSILDVSAAAHQPFCDDRYILCYNGEIYNYRELGEQLAAEGVALTTTSDTEVSDLLGYRKDAAPPRRHVRLQFSRHAGRRDLPLSRPFRHQAAVLDRTS